MVLKTRNIVWLFKSVSKWTDQFDGWDVYVCCWQDQKKEKSWSDDRHVFRHRRHRVAQLVHNAADQQRQQVVTRFCLETNTNTNLT